MSPGFVTSALSSGEKKNEIAHFHRKNELNFFRGFRMFACFFILHKSIRNVVITL